MAETTPLGFVKPSGSDLFKNGDNAISTNAQKDQVLHASHLGRLGAVEALVNSGAGGAGLSEDPLNPGFYYFAGPSFAADPADPGYYLIGD